MRLSILACLSVVRGALAAEWPFDITTITATDGSITARFVSLGATMTELWVNDKFGKQRDVILGYDDNSQLLYDPAHPVFNPVVGRYANRIKNGTFSMPITKDAQPDEPGVYHITTNDHDGADTLHGGIYGWDRRTWTIVEKTSSSVTYIHYDQGDEGFPGIVITTATHSVHNGGRLQTTVHANASELTPIMTTQHVYWNLDAFQGSEDILDHTLHVDGSKVVAVDSNAIPTGSFINVTGSPFDFRTTQKIGARWNETINLCGEGCQGYDSCWIYDHAEDQKAGVTLSSDVSGIRLDITTNQPAVQVYTAYWFDTPRKVVHGGPSLNYTSWSAVAIEQEGYIDAINTPEWNVDQIYGPGKDFEWSATYKFSTFT
ncbi:galactose mutarotase-like protein [Punctularia strigosozonata HHB-11173 SS5]|uniref:galactose mutarotase-like protein n=1 Tax=Punctularia strigosozonata (strain HHB-11173) TaxID=741275 RepID=UPI0004418567|nr:galactose mutarotase-like protein [Punctularia strigosozonata HHB-11173 SS5]EIN08587.1 galactose mutarotase-like protein [Punctularia strigosozonata HHB-11173 SS5]